MILRRKIVALTLCLLLLLGMTAAASLLLQNRISEHFSAVVDDYLPLNAAVGTVDVFTDRYELDLRRLAADLRDAGASDKMLAQQGEAERLREAGVLTTTFQKTEAQLDQIVRDPRASVDRRLAMAPVAPGLFALAGLRAVSGRELLQAFILGVEISCRVGLGVMPTHYRRGWHITATCGIFGAAAACARLLRLDAQRTAWALGHAATQSTSLVEGLGSMAKSLGVGNAAKNGLAAAMFAEAGFSGPA